MVSGPGPGSSAVLSSFEMDMAIVSPCGQELGDQGKSNIKVDEENAEHKHHKRQCCRNPGEDGEWEGEEEEERDHQ